MPYVRDSFWAGRECGPRGRHAGGRAALVPRGRRAPPAPLPGRCRPGGRVRRGGGRRPAPLPAVTVRAGPLVDAEGRAGLPHQGRQGALLGAVAADRPPRRRPRGRPHRRGVRRRRAGQDPSPGRTGPPDRLQRLPAREGGLLHAHPGVVPAPGRRARPAVAELVGRCWRSTPCTGCAPLRASSVSPTATASSVSTPPAGGRSRSAIRAIAR